MTPFPPQLPEIKNEWTNKQTNQLEKNLLTSSFLSVNSLVLTFKEKGFYVHL